MARQLRIEYPGAFYHDTSRGNEWLSTDFILGYFGENHSVAQRRYKNYVRSLLGRKMKLYLCHRYSGIKLNEIGACFDIGESGVSQTSRRFSEHLKNDKKVRKATAIVKKKLDM